ncbi:MAG: questin oxidase family protein [Tissierellia bacterium]|nr:questin oxidase family protein [Tissierellia bacterium]
MAISEIINYYGEKHRPYMGGLVNHLPMGQLAIYKMSNDLDKVNYFTEAFLERNHIDQVTDTYPRIDGLEETLGKRELYESCLEFLSKEINQENLDEYMNHILNKYILGLSSGLFHTTIRLAYAIEGVRLDSDLINEVERGLAYYVTAYRESKLFTRSIQGSDIKEEMTNLVNDEEIRNILESQSSLGKKIRALYGEKDFLDKGFIIEGSQEDKIKALLNLLVPAYYFSGNIVVLHCITALHAVVVLRDYFDDFSRALDILTTSILTHLLTISYHDYIREIGEVAHVSWEGVLSIAAEKTDVHTVKLAYSGFELSRLFGAHGLKEIAIKRIRSS